MKVYCPCGKRCKGFSGSPRKCEQISGPTEMMPQEFVHNLMSQQEGVMGQLLAGALGAFSGSIVQKMGGKLTYYVYRCPGCKCRVLVQNHKHGDSTDTSEVGQIAQC